eukprot:m.45776 g.45776  ORF g.45776 m.45776 type:complete len:387 (+) comp15268_c1_seq1:141-1301(+)
MPLSPREVTARCRLPLKATVSKGFLGRTDEVLCHEDSLAQGDEFLLLYSTRERSFEARDRHGRHLLVPRKDDLRFFKLTSGDVDEPEQHADYEAVYTADELTSTFSFPVTVRIVMGSTADLSGSSAFALVLMREVVNDFLIIATSDMQLTQLSVDLDVEFEVNRRVALPPAVTRRVSNAASPPAVAASRLSSASVTLDEELYIAIGGEENKNEAIYQSMADYQDMKTIGGKAAARVGQFSAYASVDIVQSGAVGSKLRVAEHNLEQTRAKGHNDKSPVVQFWVREIINLKQSLADAAAAPPIRASQPAAATARCTPTKAEVIRMDVNEVCGLLGKLGLDRFAPAFEHHCITGSMFLQLEDEMLHDELGMIKKFDRLKVLQFQSKVG